MRAQTSLHRRAGACLLALGLVSCGGGDGPPVATIDASTPDARAAVAVPSRVDVDSSWPYLGIGINALTSADPGWPHGGAVFHDTAVWIRKAS